VGTQYNMVLIFFIYGLAFFSMGLAITLEANRGSDTRLRHGLRALAIFGLLHASTNGSRCSSGWTCCPAPIWIPWHGARRALPCWNSLSCFSPRWGNALAARQKLSPRQHPGPHHLSHNLGVGIVVLRNFFTIDTGLWDVADVWTRYAVAVPAGLLACHRLDRAMARLQEGGHGAVRTRRPAGSIAFALYGLLGQTIVAREPAAAVNRDQPGSLLAHLRFPIQLLRAGAAVFRRGDYSFPAIV